MKKKESLCDLFLELAKPDKDGFSRKVSEDEFVGGYAGLKLGNGGSWCRDDGTLAKKYNIIRHKKGRGNKIEFIQLESYKKNPIQKPIPMHIKKALKNKLCVVLGISNVEIDHKDGRRDDPRLNDANKVEISDFQPLSKAVNAAKRQHCKKCRETGKRFDATKLGYEKAQVKGGGDYNGTCIGCYWYDPLVFNQQASKR